MGRPQGDALASEYQGLFSVIRSHEVAIFACRVDQVSRQDRAQPGRELLLRFATKVIESAVSSH